MNAARSTWGRTALIAVAASALSVLAMSVVVSAQGGQEQIYACVNDRGSPRFVPASESCAAGEDRVVWNVQGPQGAAGAVGPAGAPGAVGPQGPKGLRGRPGKKGKIDLSGYDVKTAIILSQLKQIKKEVSAGGDIWKTVHFIKGYLKGSLPDLLYRSRQVCKELDLHDKGMTFEHYGQYGAQLPSLCD